MKLFRKLDDGKAPQASFVCGIISIAVIVFLLDQVTKFLVTGLIRQGARVQVIPGFFDLTYITNTGAAWGMFSDKGWMLLMISCAVFVLVLFFIKKICDGWTERYFAIMLVVGGILGNTCDRIFRGAVVDFLRFHAADKYAWPSFNVADSAICIGVFIYVLSVLVRPEEAKEDHALADVKHQEK